MKNGIQIILLILFLTVPWNGFAQNKIETSKAQIKSGSGGSGHHKGGESRTYSANEGNDYASGCLSADGIIHILWLVTYYALIGDYEYEEHLHSNLSGYPFYNGKSGNYESVNANPSPTRYLRFDLENSFLYSNERLNGNHARLRIRPLQYFFIQGNYFGLKEYDKLNPNYARLDLFNFNLCYDRIRFENFNLGWSLGVNYIGNEVNKAGFSYGLNAGLFLAKHLSFYSSVKWSEINEFPVFEFEIQCKYHICRFFVSLGFEHLLIGTPNYDFISSGAGIYL